MIGQSLWLLLVIVGGRPLPNAVSLEAAAAALKILRANDSEETLTFGF